MQINFVVPSESVKTQEVNPRGRASSETEPNRVITAKCKVCPRANREGEFTGETIMSIVLFSY